MRTVFDAHLHIIDPRCQSGCVNVRYRSAVHKRRRPYHPADLELICETLGEKLAGKVLYQNAADWYLKRWRTAGQ